MTPAPESKTKLAFIGCGPTTMGAVYRLHELVQEGKLDMDKIEVTVIERTGVAGGLATSIVDDNNFAWDMGVHIHAHPSKYDCFTKCIDEAIPDWNLVRRCVKADMGHIFADAEKEDENHEKIHSYVPYPVQMAVPLFPPAIRDSCMKDLRDVQAQTFDAKPAEFGEWTYRAFGKTLQDIFVRPYNNKVWTVDLEEMNSYWVGDRVATVNVPQLEQMSKKSRSELMKDDLGWGPNTFFRYPQKLRGCGFEWQEVHKLRPQNWFKFKHEAKRVDPENKILHSVDENNADISTPYDYLLSTMPITLLGKISGLAPDIKLQHSKVVLVGIGMKKPQPEFYQSLNWAYYPAPDLPFYRVTYLSNFNDVMTPDPSKYWSVVCEIGLKPDAPVDEAELVEKTIDGLMSRGVFESRDQVVDKWSTLLVYGYPIPTVNRDTELRKTHKTLQEHSIYSRGRFGGWKYEVANQDHSFAQGYEWVNNILYGDKEMVYDPFA